jgi:polyisoprenoid-binding protein YceI
LGAAGSTPPALPSLPVPDGFTPVALEGGKAMLSQDNTLIQFVGKHTQGGEDDPMARIGIFEKFSGEVVIDPATKTLISAMAEIDTTTLYTPIGNLTNHLKNHEFLDVEVHPTAKFVSTRVEPGDEPGKYNVIGNLTLHGVTKEITIPASVTVDDAGVTVYAQTKLKRSDFGITHEAINERIMPEVDLTLTVGKRTERP